MAEEAERKKKLKTIKRILKRARIIFNFFKKET
jgi:hypothetical protein